MTARLLALGLLAVLFAAVAIETTGGRGEARVPTVDGHGVHWWAARARANKRDFRWQRQRVAKLKQANRQRLELTGDLVPAFLCLMTHEALNAGAWRANTGNGYYGGLQMDRDFQQAYGREFYERLGTADRWPAFVQVAVAMRAYYSGRGFGPWPNTRRACGI